MMESTKRDFMGLLGKCSFSDGLSTINKSAFPKTLLVPTRNFIDWAIKTLKHFQTVQLLNNATVHAVQKSITKE